MPVPKRTFTENLSSQVDGTRDTFEASRQYDPGSLVVYLNGQRLESGTIAGGDGFEEVPPRGFRICVIPRVRETVQVQYEADDTGGLFPYVQVSGIDPAL